MIIHFVAFHFWRALAALAAAVYARRREPALWLIGLIILELIVSWVVWGPLLGVI